MKKKKIISTTSNKIAKLKHYFILSIHDASGNVVDTISRMDYDMLLLEGMERAKEVKGFWEIFNSLGVRLDGSFDRGHK